MKIKFIKVMNATLYHGVSMAWNIDLNFKQILINSVYFKNSFDKQCIF